MDFRT